MTKFIARLLFVLTPAIILGCLLSLIGKPLGVIVFLVMVSLGWMVTEPVRSRGEG